MGQICEVSTLLSIKLIDLCPGYICVPESFYFYQQSVGIGSNMGFILKQDDFLPRTATPLEDIFKSLFW